MSIPLQIAIGAFVVLVAFTVLVHIMHREPSDHPPDPPPAAAPPKSPAREPEDPRRQFKASDDPPEFPRGPYSARGQWRQIEQDEERAELLARALRLGIYFGIGEDIRDLRTRVESGEAEARKRAELQKKLLL